MNLITYQEKITYYFSSRVSSKVPGVTMQWIKELLYDTDLRSTNPTTCLLWDSAEKKRDLQATIPAKAKRE